MMLFAPMFEKAALVNVAVVADMLLPAMVVNVAAAGVVPPIGVPFISELIMFADVTVV